MKNVRKKTQHPIHEVLRVLKIEPRRTPCVQRGIQIPYVIEGVPEGHYCIVKGRVVCPKKRNQKVLVLYTSAFEQEI